MFISKGFKLTIVIFALLVALSHIACAQEDFPDVDSAALHISQNYTALINNFVLTGMPMPPEMVDNLEESTIKNRGIMKYRKEFEGTTKYQFNMIYAFIDHFRGNADKAVSRAKSVYRAADGDSEMRDCYLYIAYLNRDYEDINKNANKLDLGSKALATVAEGNELLARDVQKFQNNIMTMMQQGGVPTGNLDPNNAPSGGSVNFGLSEPNIPGTTNTTQSAEPVPMGGHDGFGGNNSGGGFQGRARTTPANNEPAADRGNRGNRGNRGTRGGGEGMGYGVGAGLGGGMPVDSSTELGGRSTSRSSRTTSSNRPTSFGGNNSFGRGRNESSNANSTQEAGASSALNLKPELMPVSMLGKQLSQMTLQDINGSVLNYKPGQGKLLCMLLWSYGDSLLPTERRTMLKAFTESMGGFGMVQFVSVNCNDITNPLASKFLIDDIAKSPSPWVNCIMSPENQQQLADIEPASPVMLFADAEGIVRYVGPAEGAIADAIMVKELMGAVNSLGGMSQITEMMGGGVQKSITDSMNQVMDSLKDQVSSMTSQMENQSAEEVNTTEAVTNATETEEKPEVKTETVTVKKVSLEEDPTIHQARQKLQLAETKMKIKFGISFGSALTLCDEVIEGWPGTEEAEQAKAYIREILSHSRAKAFRKQRIREGKYVGKED